MIEKLSKLLEEKDIVLTDLQKQQFQTYFELLIEWNEKMNLTAITEKEEVALKHFYDSATLLMYTDVKQNSSMIDVGTGAGFPSVPIKILRPDIKLTLLDSLNKRLMFLNEVCLKLGIEANLIHRRAEEGGKDKKLRDRFDYSVSRAVANMNTLCEYCMPYVKAGGSFIAMKGKNGKEEYDGAISAVNALCGKLNKLTEFKLPNGDERVIIEIEKIAATPKQYPRTSSKIKNNSL